MSRVTRLSSASDTEPTLKPKQGTRKSLFTPLSPKDHKSLKHESEAMPRFYLSDAFGGGKREIKF